MNSIFTSALETHQDSRIVYRRNIEIISLTCGVLGQAIASVVNEQRESRSTSSLVSKVRTFGDLSTLSDWLGHRCRLVSLSPATSNRACVRRHRSVFLSFCPSAVDRCTIHTFNQRNDPRARSLYDRRNRMLSRDDKSIAEVAQEEVDG